MIEKSVKILSFICLVCIGKGIWKMLAFKVVDPDISILSCYFGPNWADIKLWGPWKASLFTPPYLPSLLLPSFLFSSLPPFPNSVSFSRWSWSLFCWINSQAYLSGFSQKKKKKEEAWIVRVTWVPIFTKTKADECSQLF